MKKQIWGLSLSALLLLTSLVGCGAGGDASSQTTAPASIASDSAAMDSGFGAAEAVEMAASADAKTAPAPAPAAIRTDAKLILSADIAGETRAFAQADVSIREMIAKAGGYLESSSVSGAEGNRNASYTVRLPQEQFQGFLDQLGDTCNITRRSQSAEDIGQAYFDAEAHVKTLRVKHERLLSLLQKSEKMEDIIQLENALNDCEYELEQYETTLRRYDNLVSFSTVRIELYEVADLTAVPAGNSFVSELKTALQIGTRGFTGAVRGLLLGIAAIWPLIVLLAIGGGVTVVMMRRRRAARKANAPKDDLPPEP